MILNNHFIYDLEYIRRHEQVLIEKKPKTRIKNFKLQNYRVDKKLQVRDKKANKYEDPYKGPYSITNIWINLTVAILWVPYKSE